VQAVNVAEDWLRAKYGIPHEQRVRCIPIVGDSEYMLWRVANERELVENGYFVETCVELPFDTEAYAKCN
jgi:hypothetical protein